MELNRDVQWHRADKLLPEPEWIEEEERYIFPYVTCLLYEKETGNLTPFIGFYVPDENEDGTGNWYDSTDTYQINDEEHGWYVVLWGSFMPDFDNIADDDEDDDWEDYEEDGE